MFLFFYFSKRRSLDELTNISLNFDAATNNSTNTTLNNNTLNNNANVSDGQLNSSKFETGANAPEIDEDSVVYDELAFLCSGQFKIGIFCCCCCKTRII